MAFSFVASSFIDSDSLTSLTVNKPTGTVNDDIMFTIIHRPSGGSPTPPSGWTSIGTQANYYLYWKKASSEGADYTWGFTGSVRTAIVVCTYRGGFDLTNPIDVVSNTVYTTSNTILRASSMNVTYVNSPIIFLGSASSTSSKTFTPPTSPATFTEDVDIGTTLSDTWTEIASMVWTGSGSTGNMDATISIGLSPKHAFAVALVPDVIGNSNGNFLMFM